MKLEKKKQKKFEMRGKGNKFLATSFSEKIANRISAALMICIWFRTLATSWPP
jgi:hypothetical protein